MSENTPSGVPSDTAAGTPSQAEGEREPDTPDAEQPPRTTPSQAEGDDPAADEDEGTT
ncbi:hypothetical protein ACH4NF_20645 [Streptomyces sp. NPDC017248]|uniref:hypothetical protein n=1 Tax=unclassified Streptomyces TaxID=2593676 RepID=UPI003798422C